MFGHLGSSDSNKNMRGGTVVAATGSDMVIPQALDDLVVDVFNHMDKDASGTVSQSELNNALKDCGHGSAAIVKRVMETGK